MVMLHLTVISISEYSDGSNQVFARIGLGTGPELRLVSLEVSNMELASLVVAGKFSVKHLENDQYNRLRLWEPEE